MTFTSKEFVHRQFDVPHKLYCSSKLGWFIAKMPLFDLDNELRVGVVAIVVVVENMCCDRVDVIGILCTYGIVNIGAEVGLYNRWCATASGNDVIVVGDDDLTV